MAWKNLALFDFDGTLTRKDTFVDFICFYHGALRALLGFSILLPIIFIMKTGVISRVRAKQIMFTYFFRGISVNDFNKKGIEYINRLNALIRPSAIKRLNQHLTSGDRVIVITASAYAWVKPWTDAMGIEVIATHWEERDNKLTGKISGFNCNGKEKVRRLKELLDPMSYNNVYAYGDTLGDHDLLLIATERHYRVFKD